MAEPLLASALAIEERAFCRDSPWVAQTLQTYALDLRYTDRAAEADELDARAQAILDRTAGTS